MRRARVRSRNLERAPAPSGWARPSVPPGVRIGPLDRGAGELAPLYAAAYPPDHPDWAHAERPEDFGAELAGILDGSVAGPRLDSSRLATAADGTPAGVLVVTQLDDPPPFGGPWVAELFRRPGPELRGTGRGLLQAGLAAATAAGLGSMGLAVSEGNPAERLYAELGFEPVRAFLSVIIPG
jgi:GNAT superfamily N-acetyltransferase